MYDESTDTYYYDTNETAYGDNSANFEADEYIDYTEDDGWSDFADESWTDWGTEKTFGSDDEKFATGDAFAEEWAEPRNDTMGMDPFQKLAYDRESMKNERMRDELDKSWWEKLYNNKDFWSGMTGLLGTGLKAYQEQQKQKRAEDQSDKEYERQKDFLQFKKNLYAAPAGGGGGGGDAGGFKYTPGITTGTFKK